MGIKVTSSFDEQASLPLDSREVQLNLTNRDAIPSSVRYEGMTVYVIGDKMTYQLVNGITNTDWVEFGSGGNIIDDANSSLTTTYSSDKIDGLISGSLNYLGAWDASTNTPFISDGSGVANEYYKVSIQGTQNLGSGAITFDVGDDVIHNGTVWEKFGSSPAPVDSVNGKTGTVVLTTTDIAEGTNLYYTDTRVLNAVSGAGYGIIDDTTPSLTTVYSSSHLDSLIAGASDIDDNVDNTSTTKTWSASKIASAYMPIDVDYGTF